MSDLYIRNIGTIVSGDLDSPVASGDAIVVRDGKIAYVGADADSTADEIKKVIDAAGATVIPAASYPVLVAAGSDDHVCSSATLSAWRAALPGGSVHVIPGGDHFFSGGLAPLRTGLAAWTARVSAAGAAASRCPPTG